VSRFDRYVLGQLLLLFGFFALVLVSVYWINRAVLIFDELISDGQSAGTFLNLSLLTLPNVTRMVLPIAAFASAVYVTNRLTVESELVIAQSIGQSPWRLARPVVAFGLVASLLMGALVHVLVPESRTALAEREARIEANVTARMVTEGRFLHPADHVTFFVREIGPDGALRDVFLSDARGASARTTYMASEGYIVGDSTTGEPVLVMLDGSAQTYEPGSRRLSTTTFESFSYDVAELAGGAGRGRRDVREYPTPVLFAPDAAALEETGAARSEFLYEGHLRVVQPFTPLIAALIGFASLRVGGYSRFGVWRQIGLAVALILVAQLGENAVADIARRTPSLWPLIYAPFVAGLAVALAMLWIAAHPGMRIPRRRAEAAP
jgi:lipopolysaccharide export system permease protein